jgi:hypothetical protein
MESVPHNNPSAGLRPVSSLLRQLGKKELLPLKRHEMEWVYGLTGEFRRTVYGMYDGSCCGTRVRPVSSSSCSALTCVTSQVQDSVVDKCIVRLTTWHPT